MYKKRRPKIRDGDTIYKYADCLKRTVLHHLRHGSILKCYSKHGAEVALKLISLFYKYKKGKFLPITGHEGTEGE
jgi:hypothetical protein